MLEGENRDLVGLRWLSLVGGGYASGLLAALALAGPLYLVLPARLVDGWATVPSFVEPLGYVLAALLGVGGGVVAGLPAVRPIGAGAMAGAAAGSVVYGTIAAPAIALAVLAPAWQGLALPHDDATGAVMLAHMTMVLMLAAWLGCALVIATFTGLGALGGSIAASLQTEPQAPADPAPFAALSSAGTAGPLVLALAGFALVAALDPLEHTIASKLPGSALLWLDHFAMSVAPASIYVAAFAGCAAVGAVGAAQSVRYQGRGGTSQAWMIALATLGAALGFTVGAFTAAPSSVWPTAGIITVGIAAVAFWQALRTPSPLPGSPRPETLRESAAAGITDSLFIWNPFLIVAITGGLAAALGVVPLVAAVSNEGPVPDTKAMASTLFNVCFQSMVPSFVVMPLLMIALHMGIAQLVKRRQAAAPA